MVKDYESLPDTAVGLRLAASACFLLYSVIPLYIGDP